MWKVLTYRNGCDWIPCPLSPCHTQSTHSQLRKSESQGHLSILPPFRILPCLSWQRTWRLHFHISTLSSGWARPQVALTVQRWGADLGCVSWCERGCPEAILPGFAKICTEAGNGSLSSECMELELHLRCPLRERENRKESALEKKKRTECGKIECVNHPKRWLNASCVRGTVLRPRGRLEWIRQTLWVDRIEDCLYTLNSHVYQTHPECRAQSRERCRKIGNSIFCVLKSEDAGWSRLNVPSGGNLEKWV